MQARVLTTLGCALALAGCSSGDSGNAFFPSEIVVPFQTTNPQTFSAANNDGPATATAQFTAGAGIVASGVEPADTALNTVTISLDGNNGIQTINVAVGTTGAAIAGTTNVTSGPFIEDAFNINESGDLSQILGEVAVGAGPFVIFQGANAIGLSSSAYGLWAVNTGGANYNVGVFAFGKETSAGDMATLAVTGAPVSGVNQTTLTYNGATIGFGSYTTLSGTVGAPFTFTGTAQVVANFATSQVTTIAFSGIATQDVNDTFAGPTLTTLANTAPVAITGTNKYTAVLAGTASNGGAAFAIGGPVNGTFYGPLALETAGTYSSAGGAVKLIGSFGAGPSHQ